MKKLSKVLIYTICIVFFSYICLEHNFLWLCGRVPSFDKLERPPVDITSELYSADNVILGRFFRENRTPVEYNKISPIMIKTLIATEDVNFYEHGGIDWKATASIFYYAAQGNKRGGSTITQQLAKNLFKTRRGTSQGLLGYIPGVKILVSKLKEYVTSVKLEMVYNKDQIITMYLNTVDFGYNSYGIKTAAKTFFNTTPDSLNYQQAATLVGVLKATTLYSPVSKPKNSINRRNVVIGLMAKHGILTNNQADSIKKIPIELKFNMSTHDEGAATYFRTAVGNFLNKWCDDNGYDLYSDGLKIHTTIDSKLQGYAEEAVAEQMKDLQRKFDRHWKGQNPWIDENKVEIKGFLNDAIRRSDAFKNRMIAFKNDESKVWAEYEKKKKMRIFSWDGELDTMMTPRDSMSYYKRFLFAGFMTLDPFKGHIKTWVGGINYKYFQYDHVNQSKRQPGSTFKPIVYLAAIDKFGYGPCDRIRDQPISFNYYEDKNGELVTGEVTPEQLNSGEIKQKNWNPRNSDWKITFQNMTLRQAMGKSVNTVTSQLIKEIGPESIIEYARKLGIKSPLKKAYSLGLGASDVSLYEMVSAYGTFLNTGVHIDPTFITKIIDNSGKVVFEHKPVSKRVLSEETSWLMLYMLRGGLEEPGGTSQALFGYDLFRGNEFGGKTGTSSNHSDGWFMGVSKDLVSGAWVGAADRSVHFRISAYGEGSKTALPIYAKFMEKAYRDKTSGVKMGYFPKPTVTISKEHNCRSYAPKISSNDSTTANTDTLFMPEETIE